MSLLLLFQNALGAGPVSSVPLEVFVGAASLPSVSNTTIHVAAGDTFIYKFPITVNGAGVPFSSPTAEFKLVDAEYALIGAKAVVDISAVTEENDGIWTAAVTFAAMDTYLLVPWRQYYFQLRVTDGTNSYQVADGVIVFTPNL